MNSCELVNLVSMLTCLIFQNYNDDEISLLSAIFTQLGDSLATILANNELIENRNTDCGSQPLH
ncbi:MAG: hypothetical protein K2H53_05105 [Clostridia bacterium]|nr:hypothetical protein [Clostridia bacterium]